MKFSDLLINFEYDFIHDLPLEVTDIVYDSRKVTEGCVFVCLKGYTSDGHKYIASAIENGAKAIVLSDEPECEIPLDIAVVKTPDTRFALAMMSAEFFGNPADELMTIAITGTKGKTTTTAMIAEIFASLAASIILCIVSISLS